MAEDESLRSFADTLLERPIADATDSIRTTWSGSGVGEGPSLMSLSTSKLELGEVLGKGGMGVVHLADQPHLGRKVAVKRPRGGEDDQGVRALLSEAFVTGQLEHPNIVPIHDIILSDDSEPQVVLKRIEGASWKSLLEEPEEVRRRFDAADPLVWHLRVLLSVCQALRFAHSRGIVHRDVKPANVMLGKFGEIYLLDWGLAWRVPEEDETAEREPLAGIGGTPAYMAPEQFDPDVAVGPHTDIYLLGSTLYEILAGRPPRTGKSLMRLLQQAVDGPPPLPDDAPPELSAIVNKAMAPLPEDRFTSVQDLRLAIESFLEHRASRQLAARAEESVAIMDAAHAEGDEAAAERAFVEATFGYRAAIDAWGDNVQAAQALRALMERRIEAALDGGAVETASRLLALDPEVPAALSARVRDAVKEHARREEELSRVAAAHDRTQGVGTRRVLTVVVFGSWVGWWTHAGASHPMAPGEMVVGAAAITVFSSLLAFVARHRLSSEQNKNLVVVVITMMLGTVSWLLAAAQLEVNPAAAPVALFLVWAVSTIIGALSIDKRALPAGIVYFAGFALAAMNTSHITWLLGATNLFWLVNALVVNVLVAREGAAR